MNIFIEQLLKELRYEDSHLISSDNPYYDYLYKIAYDETPKIEGDEFYIIGIKYIECFDDEYLYTLHKYYWNKNDIPISILVCPDEIRVYNNFKFDIKNALLFSSQKQGYQKIKIDDLSSESIGSNSFWDKLDSIIDKKERVDTRLLNNLEATIKTINECIVNKKSDTFDLITKCILIKYLEDRKILADSTFSIFNCKDFSDVLANGKDILIELFTYLKNRFNGQYFDINDNTAIQSDEAISIISRFFDGDEIITGQLSLFPYDFSIIPIELISSIYERFFDIVLSGQEKERTRKDTGSFYTPYFFADYIIKRNITISNENYDSIKVLDPACGSGVFLVGVFKKIVSFYKEYNHRIDSNLLQKIINNQIFGIDNNMQALKITEFSLYIALLDYLEPKDLEKNNFILPTLIGNTLLCNSFFEDAENIKSAKFDYIIGNPPWRSVKGDHVDYCNKFNKPISDNQIAQAFVYRATDYLRPTGNIVFILPNSIFHNSNAKIFRESIMENNSIIEVLNFSSISSKLFSDASYPCSVVRLGLGKRSDVVHIMNFKPNVFSRFLNKIALDLNSNYLIKCCMFEKYDYLWTIALGGNYYDFRLIKKLKEINYNLNDFCIEFKLSFGQGFAKGNNKKTYSEYKEYPILNDEMNSFFVNVHKLHKNTEDLKLERIHNKRQYEDNIKVIFRRTLKSKYKTNIAAFYSGKLLFNNKYYSIFSEQNGFDKNVLFFLEGLLNSKLYIYYQFHMSTAFNINPPEIRKDKVLDFPVYRYDYNNKYCRNIVETCINIHKEYNGFHSLSYGLFIDDSSLVDKVTKLTDYINEQIFSLYQLENEEIDTVSYTVDYLIPIARNKRTGLVNNAQMNMYCEEMKSMFFDLLDVQRDLSYQNKIYPMYACAVFSFEKTGGIEIKFDSYFGEMTIEKINEQLLVSKKITIFNENSVCIIKSLDSFNWQKFNAIVDFQEIIADSFLDETEIVK